MSLRPVEPLAARPTPVAARPTTRSLAAVLAAGQRESTDLKLPKFVGNLLKTDYVEKFREALMKSEDDKRKDEKVKEAASKLTTEQIKELEAEFKKYEEAGWKEMADNTALEGPDRDTWKGQVARLVAQRKVLLSLIHI